MPYQHIIDQTQTPIKMDNPSTDVTIVRETTSSVTIKWTPVESTEVYKVEQLFKQEGWKRVHWTSKLEATVCNLEDNFCYKFRVTALKFSEENAEYRELCVSNTVVGCTSASPPSTMCLYRAIRKGQQYLVKRLIKRRPSLIEHPAQNGYSPLANAITIGEMSIVDTLLSAGADVNIGSVSSKRTALHLAFFYGHMPVARMLLNKRADLNARDCSGLTPSHYAVDANQYEMLKFALENKAGKEIRDGCGWTLVMRSIAMGSSLNITKLLVTHGANLQLRDHNNQSCRDLAKLFGNDEALAYVENYLRCIGRFKRLKIRKGDNK